MTQISVHMSIGPPPAFPRLPLLPTASSSPLLLAPSTHLPAPCRPCPPSPSPSPPLPLLPPQVSIEFTSASVSSPGVDLLVQRLPGDVDTLMKVADRGLHISNNNTLMYSNIRQRGAEGFCWILLCTRTPAAMCDEAYTIILKWHLQPIGRQRYTPGK